jgi:hypothetical protein
MKVKTDVKAGQASPAAPLINVVVGNSTTGSPIDNRAGGAGIIAIGGSYTEA